MAPKPKICTAEHCRNDVFRVGLCDAHYQLARIARKKELAAERRASREHTAETRSAVVARSINAMIRGHAADESVLPELVALESVVRDAAQRAVDNLRSPSGGAFSWAEVGALLGITPQAAQQRYGKRRRSNVEPIEAARKVGGQPASLR